MRGRLLYLMTDEGRSPAPSDLLHTPTRCLPQTESQQEAGEAEMVPPSLSQPGRPVYGQAGVAVQTLQPVALGEEGARTWWRGIQARCHYHHQRVAQRSAGKGRARRRHDGNRSRASTPFATRRHHDSSLHHAGSCRGRRRGPACGRRGHLAALSGLNMMQVALLTCSIPRTLPEPNADQDAAARRPGRRALVRRDVSPSQERAGTRQTEGAKDGMTVWCEATHEGHIGRDKGCFATKPDSRRKDPLDRGWSIRMRSIGPPS